MSNIYNPGNRNDLGYILVEWVDTKHYYLNSQYHRIDGPAFINKDVRSWYLHGLLHRLDGPAQEFTDGKKTFWEKGKYLFDIKDLIICKFCKYKSEDKEDLLVHYDLEEEKGNILSFHNKLRNYLNFGKVSNT